MFPFVHVDILFSVFFVIGYIHTQTAPSSYQLTPDELDIARQKGLDIHNYYRRLHNVSEFTLNKTLNKFSQDYALQLAGLNKLVHSNHPDYGENLYFWCKYPQIPNITSVTEIATKSFYDEIQFYDYLNPHYTAETAHFTQLVWKSSEMIGIGVGLNRRIVDGWNYSCVYVCVNYLPYGNIAYPSVFNKNVLPANSIILTTTQLSTTVETTTVNITKTTKKTAMTTKTSEAALNQFEYSHLVVILLVYMVFCARYTLCPLFISYSPGRNERRKSYKESIKNL